MTLGNFDAWPMQRPPTPPWKRPAPKVRKKPTPLTPAQKDAARQRAEAGGRRYPNLIDNMWAAKLPKG